MKREEFWECSVNDLKRGYVYDENEKCYCCALCEEKFIDGIVYSIGDYMVTAEKAVEMHCEMEHGNLFYYYLQLGKIYTGLSNSQMDLIKLFYDGLTDKEIVQKTDIKSLSTVRNQRFSIKEKYKQAKILMTLYELLKEKKNQQHGEDELIEIPRTVNCLDERFAITEAERCEVLNRYFDSNMKLIIKEFPAKEKKKIIIMQQIMQEFESNKLYTEKEINEILNKYYDDHVTIRRYLIQYGFMDRTKDSKSYWVKK